MLTQYYQPPTLAAGYFDNEPMSKGAKVGWALFFATAGFILGGVVGATYTKR